MLDEDTVDLIRALLRATPEERSDFWKKLEETAISAGIEPGIYCPYVPLQTTYGGRTEGPVKFNTRYDDDR